MLIINEYDTKNIRIYNPKIGKSEKIVELDTYLNPKNYLDNNKRHNSKIKNEKKINKKNDNKNDKNMSYSILSMCQYQNLIAMTLIDKRIVFFGLIELVHEMKMPTLEKRIWYLPEHNIWFSSGSKLEKFTYYTLNELDVEFEFHGQKYDCYYNEGHPYRNHYCEILPHKGEILDCINSMYGW